MQIVFYSRATDFVSTEPQDFSKLIDSIKNADVIIYVGGISPRLEGEEMKVHVNRDLAAVIAQPLRCQLCKPIL